jgi:hypothetical protein
MATGTRPATSTLALLALALLIGAALLSGCGQAAQTATSAALETKTVRAGAVAVTIEPVRIDGSGAVFNVRLDSHAGSLDLDLPANSRLEVGGRAWQVDGWTGDAPGGHHRSGALRFAPAGTPAGNATLTISGLAGPVVMTWTLGSA